MYLNDGWTFLVELEGDPPLATKCLCLIDLSESDDRGDVEPYRDGSGILHCTLGVDQGIDERNIERKQISRVYEYDCNDPFNDKFITFKPVSLVAFVRRFCDAAAFDDDTEDEIEKLKEMYGV
jgi:hypothetical protein